MAGVAESMAKTGATWRAMMERQRRWARERELEVDDHGLLDSAEANFLTPLCDESRAEWFASSRPVFDRDGKPGSFRSLLATEALVSNLFEGWRGTDLAPLAAALEAAPNADSLSFAQKIPTPGESWIAPVEADVLLHGNAAKPTAVFASLAEPYADPDRRPPVGTLLQSQLWSKLPGCRHLASDLCSNPRRFQSLDVGRIVERVLALTHHYGSRRFRVALLWHEEPGDRARCHARELDRLRMRIGGEVDLVTLSWRALLRRLLATCPSRRSELDPIADRYLAGGGR